MTCKFLKNKVVTNAGWLVGGKIIQMVINLIVGLMTARFLGPSNYGLINYAAAYIAFSTSVCTLGINSVLVKEIIDHPLEEGLVLGTSFGLRFISSILSVVTIISVTLVLDAGEPTTQMIVILSSIGIIFHIVEVFNYWFQSKLQSKKTAIATLIAYLLTALYKIVLLINQKDVVYFALATTIDYIVLTVILIYFYKKSQGDKLSFSWTYGKSLLARSHHFILPGLMVAIYGQTDKMMLKHMIGNAEIGFYSTAVSICSMWCFVLSAIIDSFYPTIMKSFRDKDGRFREKNIMLYRIIIYVSVIVSIFFTVFSELIILVLYGDAYMPTVAPLRIITWYTAFSYLGMARNAWVVCFEKQRYLKYIYFTSAIVNVFLNIIFIPHLGASGAAIASLLAQFVTTMIAPLFIKDMRENTIMILEAIILKDVFIKKGKQ